MPVVRIATPCKGCYDRKAIDGPNAFKVTKTPSSTSTGTGRPVPIFEFDGLDPEKKTYYSVLDGQTSFKMLTFAYTRTRVMCIVFELLECIRMRVSVCVCINTYWMTIITPPAPLRRGTYPK